MKKYVFLLIGAFYLFPCDGQASFFKKKSSQEQTVKNQVPNKKQPGRLSKFIQSAACKKAVFQSGNGKKCSSPTVYAAVKKACGGVVPPSCDWGYNAHYDKFLYSQKQAKGQQKARPHDPERGAPQPGYSDEQKKDWAQQYNEQTDSYKDKLTYHARKEMSPTQKRVFSVDPQQGGKPVQYDEDDNAMNKAAFAQAYRPRNG